MARWARSGRCHDAQPLGLTKKRGKQVLSREKAETTGSVGCQKGPPGAPGSLRCVMRHCRSAHLTAVQDSTSSSSEMEPRQLPFHLCVRYGKGVNFAVKLSCAG